MKIQINSLAALERLLGGDTTVEIELRSAIVQEFVKKHLKALAKSAEVTKAVEATQKEVIATAQFGLNASMATFSQTWGGSVQNLKLRPEIMTAINLQVSNMVDRKLSEVVESAISAKLDNGGLDEAVKRRVEYFTEDAVRQKVKARLDALKAKL